MKIVFIGAGNVATRMALQFHLKGCTILQVYSRTIESATKLAEKIGAGTTNSLKKIRPDADFYIFSVKDSILEQLVDMMPHQNGIWLHTAGSMPINIFENKIAEYGVLYPLQTFSKDHKTEWHNIPVFIEESNHSIKAKVTDLASLLSSKIHPLSSEKRRYVHLSGVYANNFVNQMYELANNMIEKADLPFEVLLPIIEETCSRIHSRPPIEVQTGPAVRFDENVMAKHIELLETETDKQLYKLISESIYKSHESK